jgi:hypothetical protein
LGAKHAAKGDSERAKKRTKAADKLVSTASVINITGLSGKPDADGLDRGTIGKAALDMIDTSIELENEGLTTVADLVIDNAANLLNVATTAARMVPAIDTAANVIEAITGKTLDFEDDGTPKIRDTTTIERTIAIAEVGITVLGAVLGGPVGVVAAGAIVGIGRAIGKKEAKIAGKEALEIAAAKRLGKVEQEAAEKAAKETAEEAGEKLGKEAEKVAKNSTRTAIDFEKDISKLAPAERVAATKEMASIKAKQHGLAKNPGLSKKNKRDVFTDNDGMHYSLDTQHGRFEKLDKRGKHLGEVNMDMSPIGGSIDISGGHDITI